MKLLAAPNFSEGRDTAVIAALRSALDANRGVLDRHSDREHNRTVFTTAGHRRDLVYTLEAAARVAIERIDMRRHKGLHPCIGAIDVCPLVWLNEADEEDARTDAQAVGEKLAALELPVFFYGALASAPEREERAFFRNGGLEELQRRMSVGDLVPDLGPTIPHLTAGATLITARPPLAAFNIELAGPDPVTAQRVAMALREGGGGLPGVRAIGLPLATGRSQVSTNVHDPISVPLGVVVERVRELAEPEGAAPVGAEIVGLVPQAALHGFPPTVPIAGFDPARHIIERRLSGLRGAPER